MIGGPELRPTAEILALAITLDLLVGDPTYAAHPVRLIGTTLSWTEMRLRALRFDGYIGGVLLFLVLGGTSVGVVTLLVLAASSLHSWVGLAIHLLVLYTLLAFGDLLRHVTRVERALRSNDLGAARAAVGLLVGRDTAALDAAACRRAAVESLSENLADGFVSPVFWYVVGGVPAVVLFKVVSTMDSMVGHKTSRYVRFGWCGARLDDGLNYLPARMTWILIAIASAITPGCSPSAAWHVGLTQHSRLPSPNSGWSEAAFAGALRRRLAGPIYLNNRLVNDIWLGRPDDEVLATGVDLQRATSLAVTTMILASLCGYLALAW